MYHDVYCLCLFTVFYYYFTSSIDGIQGRVMALNPTFNTIHELQIDQHELQLNLGMNSGAPEEWAFPVLDVTIDNNNSQRSYLTLCNQDLISPENLKGSAKISILFQHVNR